MADNFEIRLIKETDSAEVLEIYKPYVLDTVITFEYDVPTLEDFTGRIRAITPEYPWLVCLMNNKIVGYAYASRFRYRTAYQWSAESTVYIAQAAQGMGIGIRLYHTLFDILRLQGYVNVYAGTAIPNEKSVRLHLSAGFETLGIYKKIGFKMGAWHDTQWFQLHLCDHPTNPAPLKLICDIEDSPELRTILDSATDALNGNRA